MAEAYDIDPVAEDQLLVNRQHMPFALDDRRIARAALGLIVLSSDQTVEHELRAIVDAVAGVDLFSTRIRNDNDITPESLAAMEHGLTDCAAVIIPGMPLAVIGYGCTSGSMVIGEDRVAALVQEARPEAAVTNPVTAARLAMAALGMGRIALLTPYRDAINQSLRAHFQARGVGVPVMGSFNEGDDRNVSRIDAASIRAAVLELGGHAAVDGVFVSCTALSLLEDVAALEAELGKPVTASNHALSWHMLRSAGISDALPQFGRLFTCPLPKDF